MSSRDGNSGLSLAVSCDETSAEPVSTAGGGNTAEEDDEEGECHEDPIINSNVSRLYDDRRGHTHQTTQAKPSSAFNCPQYVKCALDVKMSVTPPKSPGEQ